MKKTVLPIVAALVLTFLGVGLSPSDTMAHDLWDTCTKVDGLCEYPGDCRKYIDTNNDGICDRSQPEPATATTETQEETPETLETISPESDTSSDVASSGIVSAVITENGGGSGPAGDTALAGRGLDRYFLLPVLLGTAGAYGITWVLSNRRIMSIKMHRRIWNVVLLIATVISALLGIYLILEIDFDVSVSLPFDPLFWHVEAGIAMGMIAVFHIAWHWRYFEKMLKRAATEA